VGDPSGKTEERKSLGFSVVDENVNDLRRAVKNLFKSATKYASSRLQMDPKSLSDVDIVNNLEWMSSMSLLEFLTTAGKFARIQTMINRERWGGLHYLSARLDAKSFTTALDYEWNRNREYRLQSSHISFCKHMIFTISIRSGGATFNSAVPTSGEISLQALT
jgi:hypothetical protein